MRARSGSGFVGLRGWGVLVNFFAFWLHCSARYYAGRDAAAQRPYRSVGNNFDQGTQLFLI